MRASAPTHHFAAARIPPSSGYCGVRKQTPCGNVVSASVWLDLMTIVQRTLFLHGILALSTLPLIFLLSGCFSGLAMSKGAYLPGKKDPLTLNQTITLDVLTAPLQVPIMATALVFKTADDAKREKAQTPGKRKLGAIIKLRGTLHGHPERSWKERWDLLDEIHVRAFKESFVDYDVTYNEVTLEAIYNEVPAMRGVLFANRGCSADFIHRHFDETYRQTWASGPDGYGDALLAIAMSPHCPLDVLEILAQPEGKASESARWQAKMSLVERSRRKQTDNLIK